MRTAEKHRQAQGRTYAPIPNPWAGLPQIAHAKREVIELWRTVRETGETGHETPQAIQEAQDEGFIRPTTAEEERAEGIEAGWVAGDRVPVPHGAEICDCRTGVVAYWANTKAGHVLALCPTCAAEERRNHPDSYVRPKPRTITAPAPVRIGQSEAEERQRRRTWIQAQNGRPLRTEEVAKALGLDGGGARYYLKMAGYRSQGKGRQAAGKPWIKVAGSQRQRKVTPVRRQAILSEDKTPILYADDVAARFGVSPSTAQSDLVQVGRVALPSRHGGGYVRPGYENETETTDSTDTEREQDEL